MTRAFDKPALTIDEQIGLLRAGGMAIADQDRARHWLAHVSYYRLSGYWHIFKRPGSSPTRFYSGADFDLVTELYDFDRRLRRLVGRGTEHVEVALRGSWAYALAHKGGAHGYLDAALYADRRTYHENLGKLAREVGTSPETYIRHYRESYDSPALPAVWMIAEMMTFGQLSRWYSSLAEKALRNEIARSFGLPDVVFLPLVKHLVTVRNVCAHQGRLWNRRFREAPKLPHKPLTLSATLDQSVAGKPGTLYNTLVLLTFLLRQVAPESNWRDDLMTLLSEHPTGDLSAMGFPSDWHARPLWQ